MSQQLQDTKSQLETALTEANDLKSQLEKQTQESNNTVATLRDETDKLQQDHASAVAAMQRE